MVEKEKEIMKEMGIEVLNAMSRSIELHLVTKSDDKKLGILLAEIKQELRSRRGMQV